MDNVQRINVHARERFFLILASPLRAIVSSKSFRWFQGLALGVALVFVQRGPLPTNTIALEIDMNMSRVFPRPETAARNKHEYVLHPEGPRHFPSSPCKCLSKMYIYSVRLGSAL